MVAEGEAVFDGVSDFQPGGGAVKEGVKAGVWEIVGVNEMVGVFEGVGVAVDVGMGVGEMTTSCGYNSSMAVCQSRPSVRTNSLKRASEYTERQRAKAGSRCQPYAIARSVISTQ